MRTLNGPYRQFENAVSGVSLVGDLRIRSLNGHCRLFENGVSGWSLVGDLRVRSLNVHYRLFVQLLYFYSYLLGTNTNIFLKYTVCT
jgi:hypothetical protein